MPTVTSTLRQNIAPQPTAHKGRRLPGRPPRREELAGATRKVLRSGEPHKADLLLVDLGEGPMLVKDFSTKPLWRRILLARVQILNEHRAYRRLGPMEGLPRLIGRVDSLALAIERVEGIPLANAESRFEHAEVHLTGLRRLLDRLHARGFVHLDLRGKSNVLLQPNGELVIVDMAAARWFRPGSLAHRLFFRWFAMADETALLKWKSRLAPDRLTAEEASLLRRFWFIRKLWIFNKWRVT